MVVSTRRGLGGDEEQETQTDRAKGTAPTFIGPAARGEGPCRIQTSSPESSAPIGPDPSPWPTSLGRKPPHFVSGKAILGSGNIALRPQEMT